MRVIFSLILFLFSLNALSDQLIVEPEMGRAPVLNAINGAKHSINLVMYGFTDKTLLDALVQQKQRGKTVQVILEKEPYKAESENRYAIAAFNQYRLPWRGGVEPFKLIHQKTLMLDNKRIMIMTFNFTNSTFKNERNFALLIDDPARVKTITSVFSADWNGKAISNINNDIVLSPNNSRTQLLKLISEAKRSIDIYAQSINDYKIIGALAKAARQGVAVNIITSATMREKQASYLTRAGVNVHVSKRLYIHAKVLMIDNRKAVIGSINFTRASLDDNRELAVITEDAAVIKQLFQVFKSDLANIGNSASGANVSKRSSNFSLDKQTIDQALRVFNRALRLVERYLD